jgi:hypothetical protein
MGSHVALRSQAADGVGVEGVIEVEHYLAQRPSVSFDSVEAVVVKLSTPPEF